MQSFKEYLLEKSEQIGFFGRVKGVGKAIRTIGQFGDEKNRQKGFGHITKKSNKPKIPASNQAQIKRNNERAKELHKQIEPVENELKQIKQANKNLSGKH